MDTDRPDRVATAAAANSRDNYGGRLKAKPLVCTTVQLGVDMLKKSKPACTASSPSVALFQGNPKQFFPLLQPPETCETRKDRAAGNSRVLTRRCAKGMTELAVGSRPGGKRISRNIGRKRRETSRPGKSGIQSRSIRAFGWAGVRRALEGEGTEICGRLLLSHPPPWPRPLNKLRSC